MCIIMTVKKDSINLDAFAAIVHAAEMGIPFEEYMNKVSDYGRKRVRMIQKGLKND
jgi:hypothetical protein